MATLFPSLVHCSNVCQTAGSTMAWISLRFKVYMPALDAPSRLRHKDQMLPDAGSVRRLVRVPETGGRRSGPGFRGSVRSVPLGCSLAQVDDQETVRPCALPAVVAHPGEGEAKDSGGGR
jgi:hypothetical protein